VVYGSVDVVGASGNSLRQDNRPDDDIRLALVRGMPFTHTGTLHRTDLFGKYGRFDSGLRIAGDYDLMLRVLPHVDALFCAAYKIRMGDGGASNSRKSRRKLLIEQKYIRKKNALPWSLSVDGYINLKLLYYRVFP
jgi:hypothetical protein